MNVGSLVYATDQGLGILAKSFVDHGVVTDVMVVRHGRHAEHDEWYPGAPRIAHLRSGYWLAEMKAFCAKMDVMLFFETPFVWELIDHCREVGTKTALMVMHECLHDNVKTHTPDLFLCPSALDHFCVMKNVFDTPDEGNWGWKNTRITEPLPKNFTGEDVCNAKVLHRVILLPVPVAVPHRHRQRAEVFVHNAGWGGLKGRNGTAELLDAMRFVKSDAKLLVRVQFDSFGDLAGKTLENVSQNPKIEIRYGTLPMGELWQDGGEGDVFIFPEKFNGLSLPLQEARAAGMLVMCGDRFPMNEWLPREPLIPVAQYIEERVGPPYMEYDSARFDPQAIAAKIDEWYGRDISEYSLQGKKWAEEMSWAALKPLYVETLEDLCNS